jgi:HAD superfamily hydrolase (TIGR01509 family)
LRLGIVRIKLVANPRLLIFDCDGVLVDSEPISNEVLACMLSEQGLPTTLAQARHDYQGLLLADVAIKAQEKLGRALPVDWLSDFERRRAAVFDDELQAVPGAAKAVAGATAAGLAVCVASQGKLEKTRRSLELTGLRPLFPDHALFSAYQVPRGKPHPDLFLHAARVMGAAPGDCLVIEDTPSGVTAAVRASMPVLGYAADSDEDALRRAGAQTFHSLQELPRMLGLD